MDIADLPPSDPKFTRLIHEMQPAFSQQLGSEVVYATKDMVVAELLIRPEHGNRNGVMHGGAIMAFADDLGGAATFINLPEGAGTTTVESKTNFFAAIPLGDTARGVCTPLHRGRSTMVWQTRITRGDGKLAALITQTQMVLPGRGKTA